MWNRSDLNSEEKVKSLNFGGGMWNRSDLNSEENAISPPLKNQIPLQGWSEEFGQKILEAYLAFAS